MTPPAQSAARRSSARTFPEARPSRRPSLRVVEAPARRPRIRRRHVAETVSVLLIVGSLLAVVLGHAMLAQGQVRLSAAQSELNAEQILHRQQVLAVARLETPARIAAEAQNQFHMARAATLNQLPAVSLSTPLPAPKVAAVPVVTTPTTTATTAPASSTATTTATTGATSTATGSGQNSQAPPGGSGASTSAPGQ